MELDLVARSQPEENGSPYLFDILTFSFFWLLNILRAIVFAPDWLVVKARLRFPAI